MPSDFLKLVPEERREALAVASTQSGRPAHLLEKDVWAVWTLRQLYPCIGNTDWDDAAEMEAQALAKAPLAVGSRDDPPEFRQWLDTLRKPNANNDDRDKVFEAMHDYLSALKRERFM